MLPPGANLSNLDNKCKGSSVSGMRVGDAARQVGTSARMLRYAEELGLVTPVRTPGGYRDDGERDLDAAAYALELQARHRVIPAALAFGLGSWRTPRSPGPAPPGPAAQRVGPGHRPRLRDRQGQAPAPPGLLTGAEVPTLATMLKDPSLAPASRRKIDLTASRMPVLSAVTEELARTRPLAGHRPARHHRDGQPLPDPGGRRGRARPVRLQPALDPWSWTTAPTSPPPSTPAAAICWRGSPAAPSDLDRGPAGPQHGPRGGAGLPPPRGGGLHRAGR
jgi:MerR family regulatory protein